MRAFRRPGRRQALTDYAVALLLTGLLALLAVSPALRLLDAMFFDFATGIDAGRTPRVVIVQQDADYLAGGAAGTRTLIQAVEKQRINAVGLRVTPRGELPASSSLDRLILGVSAQRAPAQNHWALDTPEPTPSASLAANMVTPADRGMHRRQAYALPAASGAIPLLETALAGRKPRAGAYLVRMAKAQNIPQITASQLIDGVFRQGELADMVALIAPPPGARERTLTTALSPARGPTSATLFSAYAVQSLIDRREVREAPPWLVVLCVLLACLAAPLLLRTIPAKRLGLPLVFGGTLAIVAASWAVLQFANVLLPLAAMLLGFVLAGITQILRQERAQDVRLACTLEEAINLSFSRSLFHDQARIPEHLAAIARLLRLPRALVLTSETAGRWDVAHTHQASADELDPATPAARHTMALARRSATPVPAGAMVPGWSSRARLVLVADAEHSLAWLYDLPPGRAGALASRVTRSLARSLREIRGWEHTLLGGTSTGRGGRGGRAASIEARVASAARLITVQGEQIRQGLDTLDTAVLVCHPAGFPIHANSRMRRLCEEAGLAIEKATTIEVIRGLTDLGLPQVESIVQRLLLHGGEMRVPVRDLATRHYVLRIGAPATRALGNGQQVVVLEAVDVSELDQLAELRLAVGMFIDKQLRNDLEAIALGARLAVDPRLGPGKLERIVARISDVTERATRRLEDVAELLTDTPSNSTSPCYPIEARKCVAQAVERATELAADLGVTIDARLPAISGFTLAEPMMLRDMVEAILRLIVADTAQGGTVTLTLEEELELTRIAVTGGFGMNFDRLCAALDAGPGEVPAEFQIAAAGFAETLAWQGAVAYWSAAGKGYRFNIQLRRIG